MLRAVEIPRSDGRWLGWPREAQRPEPQQLAYLKSLYAADLVATTNLTQKESIEGGMKGEVGK